MMYISSTVKIGIAILITGIIASEILLFGQSISVYFGFFSIPKFYILLFTGSAFMPLGIAIMIWGYFKKQ